MDPIIYEQTVFDLDDYEYIQNLWLEQSRRDLYLEDYDAEERD